MAPASGPVERWRSGESCKGPRYTQALSNFAHATVVSVALVSSVLGLQATQAKHTAQSRSTSNQGAIHYEPGYSLQDGWFCYGWIDPAIYHCTQSFHKEQKSHSGYISDNPAFVPNGMGSHTVSPAPASVAHPSATKTQPTPPSPPAPSGSVASMIDATFGAYAGQAIAVAECESGLNPGAYNASSGASGVFQFLGSTWAETPWAGDSPFNAADNIAAAYWLFSRDVDTWREWSCGYRA